MSGSPTTDGNDTDALLIIPPDVFLDEETDDSSNSRLRRSLPQQQCMKYLAEKVDSLQTRLMHMHENVSNSESFERSPFRSKSEISFSPIKTSSQKHYSTLSNRKSKQTNRYKRSRRRLDLPPIIKNNIDFSSDSDIGFISSSLINTPDMNSDGSIIGEIDTFLSTIGCLNTRSDPIENVSMKSMRSQTNVDNILSKYIYITNEQLENVHSKSSLFDADVSKSNEIKNLPTANACNNDNHGGSEEKSNAAVVNSQMPIDYEKSMPFFSIQNENLPTTVTQSKINVDFVLSANNMNLSRDCQKDVPPVPSDISMAKSLINTSKTSYENPDITLTNNKSYDVSNTANSHSNKSLPSLCKLWNDSEQLNQNSKGNVENFEEEKMRRQHCEEIIRTLQKQLLEQQQKLAVAIQIDSAKDEAIQKLKDALVVKSLEWKNTEQKYVEEIAYIQIQSKKFSCENNIFKSKIRDNEEEIVKYERTIHEIEEKLKTAFDNVELEKSELNKKVNEQLFVIDEKEKYISELKESSEMLNRLNKQLSENLMSAQKNIDEMKYEGNDRNERLKETEATLLSLQEEISILKKEKTDLEFKTSSVNSKNLQLISENIDLKSDIKTTNEKYKELHQIFDNFKILTETQKSEMKTHYQKQLESIVTEKVNEFQKQLDLARNLMTNEIQAKEKEIAFQFAKHLRKVENGYQLEVNILEEKHREEIKYLAANLSISKKSIQNLQDKLVSYKSKRGEIASQLHSVMESQWQQALKIILNSTADLSNVPLDSIKKTDLCEPTENNHKTGESSKEKNEASDNAEPAEKMCEMPKITFNYKNGEKLTDQQLNHYVKMLLQKKAIEMDRSEGSERLLHSKIESKIKNCNVSTKNITDIEYPTSDKPNDNGDKKLHRIKPPWK